MIYSYRTNGKQGVLFRTLLFGPNKLECLFLLSWEGMPETNNLAYWAHGMNMEAGFLFKTL